MTNALPADILDQLLAEEGLTPAQLAERASAEYASLGISVSEPTSSVRKTKSVQAEIAGLRRVTCRLCEHAVTVGDHAVHCGKLGPSSGCSKSWANFSGPASRCPIGEWRRLAAISAPAVIVPDRVVCLSLASRNDRWAKVTESAQRSKYLRQWPIERYIARLPDKFIIPDYWRWGDSHYATRRDHMDILERSYAAGDETLLVLEDDAIIQECFDQAYEDASAQLPADWLGLWLSSDGHKMPPEPFSAGLVRSTDQAMLHAYLLNRAGMRRVWHHLVARREQIIDGATEDLHSIEPHFYSTIQNAVRQFGCRDKGERTDFHNAIQPEPLTTPAEPSPQRQASSPAELVPSVSAVALLSGDSEGS